MSTLKLTLSKKPFEVMITGEKKVEYRNQSQWMKSRLFDKHGNPRKYSYVEFVNGYGKDRPRFTVEFKGVAVVERVYQTFSNGLTVDIKEPVYMIRLGDLELQNRNFSFKDGEKEEDK
jgi:hypothetical protein